jgi:hypothetical protein
VSWVSAFPSAGSAGTRNTLHEGSPPPASMNAVCEMNRWLGDQPTWLSPLVPSAPSSHVSQKFVLRTSVPCNAFRCQCSGWASTQDTSSALTMPS